MSCANKINISEAEILRDVIRNTYSRVCLVCLFVGIGIYQLTLVTPLRTTLTLLRMMAPTRARLICLDSDGTSMRGIPDVAGKRENRYAKTWAIMSP